jgi:hypothetical protein
VKKIFKLSNLIPLLLVVYITKSFITGSSFFDFGVIALMSASFLYKLRLDKEIISDKEELIAIITQLKEEVNEKIEGAEKGYHARMDTLQKEQNNDRLANEGKFSTLNLGMQRQPKANQERTSYGWGSTAGR